MDEQRAAASGPVGNVYDKYGTRNPIARALMRGFLSAVTGYYVRCAPQRVLEVGCGEGLLATRLIAARVPQVFVATDLALPLAPEVDPRIRFEQGSVYALPHEDKSFDTVVCCEVLEHLGDPLRALSELLRVTSRHLIVSTPREPLWRALNLARGKYVRSFGNTPGHIQHFDRRGLVELVESRFHVLDVKTPVPWTVLWARPR